MKKATKSEIVAIVLAFISLFVVMTAGITAVWLTSEVRVFGLVDAADGNRRWPARRVLRLAGETA